MSYYTEMTNEVLWELIFSSSPLTAALALTILDERLNGRISRLSKELQEVKK